MPGLEVRSFRSQRGTGGTRILLRPLGGRREGGGSH